MIKGIGLDIVEIDRIAKAMKRTDKFKDRILTINEKKIFDGYSETRKIEFLAGRFAAKEAFSKALGTGLGEHCKLHDMEVLKGAAGNPVLYFKDELVNGFVSITHSKQYAAAQVILLE
ncbi:MULTISPECIES: holo-ACP synthase [Lysinibacillus]|uniref:holo-ACP synthase n=1 Tax=Lysinibacillus TaxID=400634 RepID=UPI001C8B50EC|nr:MULTISPECIES: holo-ACP synthase [Lysinibacillus]MBX8945069.1 holo-[acyl-carrier-protein] synthase [Lysinibacillus sp. K60]UNT56112.1 holo-ACP synthase [Lysinibacillus capsici]WHP41084.1 holo-ACP synthase [Lysinibacillus boronitolerans]